MVSSTSMFTSCKDYDDDINNLVVTKADKTALEEAKQTLENEISGLRQQLSEAEGKITTLTNNKADKFKVGDETYNLETVWNQLFPLLQRVSNCETQIGEHETAINAINEMIGGKISESDYFKDCKNYQEALIKTYALAAAASQQAGENLTAINELKTKVNDPVTGLAAVYTDLQGQISALSTLKGRVDVIEGDYLTSTDKQDLLTKIQNLADTVAAHEALIYTAIQNAENTAKAYAETKASEAQAEALRLAKEYTNGKFDDLAQALADSTKMLKDEQQKLSDRIDKNFGLINTLTVYVKQTLRGLVFRMDSYYQGVEATDLTVLYYRAYNLAKAEADKTESFGYISSTDWTSGQIAGESREVHKYVDATDKTKRYSFTAKNRVLEFVANYYMNPSNAAIDVKPSVIDFNKPFHSSVTGKNAANDGTETLSDTLIWDSEFNGKTNATSAGLSVKSWETKNGILSVKLDCKNPENIMSIVNNEAITVFATQVNIGNGDKDTLITSDFAALYKKSVDSIVIAHTPSTAKAMLRNGAYIGSHPSNAVNSHCGQCALSIDQNANEYHAGLHLMQTVSEAAGMSTGDIKTNANGGFAPQDSVGYTDSLNLNKLVEAHWTVIDANGKYKHELADVEKAGLKFRFFLTGLFYGSNETSESAHAAIKVMADPLNPTDTVYMLRPQMPDSVDNAAGTHKIGKAAPWDNEDENGKPRLKGKVGKQDRQTIGRTPLVRVELVDAAGDIVDYGYIRIKIVDNPKANPAPEIPTINYNADSMKVSKKVCAALEGEGWSWTQTWAEMEYDVHHFLGVTQDEFENNYQMVGADNIFTQFYMKDGAIKACTCSEATHSHANDTLGVIRYIPNVLDNQTSVIEWKVRKDSLARYMERLGTDAANVVRYIRFDLKQGKTGLYNSIYVSITPAGIFQTNEPDLYGVVHWNNEFNKKNQNYWYAENANKTATSEKPAGYTEIHANVLAVEDTLALGWVTPFTAFDTKLSDVFSAASEGGQANQIVKITEANLKAFVTTNNATATGDKLHYSLVFVDTTYAKRPAPYNNKNYVGNDSVTYTLTVGDIKNDQYGKGKALLAYKSSKTWETATEVTERDTIAKLVLDGTAIGTALTGNDSINHMIVQYQNNKIADALVNYKAHNELGYDVIKAVVGLKATYTATIPANQATQTAEHTQTCEVKMIDNTIDVRFLRPINVFSNDKTIEDASTQSGTQTINLRDLISLTDWRDEPFKTETGNEDYWKYYNIKAIKIMGVTPGANISMESKVKTDMDLPVKDDYSQAVSLKSKSGALDFAYNPIEKTQGAYGTAPSYGTLTYSNISNNVQIFHVWVPVEVVYQWGSVYAIVKITVNQTRSNARLAK